MMVIDFVKEFLSPTTYFILYADNNQFYNELFGNAKVPSGFYALE